MDPMNKKMKKYLKAVERKLALPKNLKERVMADLISSVEARSEQGRTDTEIFEELGSPKVVARELNEQMKEYTYRKSPWRYLFALFAVYGAVEVLRTVWSGILLYMLKGNGLFFPKAASVGVIGGADGPTAIFVTTSVAASSGYRMLLLGAVGAVFLLLGIWGFIRLGRLKNK